MTEYSGEERRKDCNCVNKEEITLLFQERDRSQTFRGQAKIAGIVAMAILGSSFIYTTFALVSTTKMIAATSTSTTQNVSEIKTDNNAEHDKLHRLVDTNEEELDDLKADIRISNDRYLRLLSDIGKIEIQLTTLVKMLQEHDDERKGLNNPPYETPSWRE